MLPRTGERLEGEGKYTELESSWVAIIRQRSHWSKVKNKQI